jgi:hypothetical protein
MKCFSEINGGEVCSCCRAHQDPMECLMERLPDGILDQIKSERVVQMFCPCCTEHMRRRFSLGQLKGIY